MSSLSRMIRRILILVYLDLEKRVIFKDKINYKAELFLFFIYVLVEF